MNPAALRVNLRDLKPAGLLVVNTGAFNPGNLKKAGYDKNPLDDGSLDAFRVLNRHLPPHHAGRRVLRPRQQEALRAKNMWTLGLMMWMFGRKRESTLVWLRQKIPAQPRRVNPQFVTAGAATGPHEAELEVPREALGLPPPRRRSTERRSAQIICFTTRRADHSGLRAASRR